MRLPFRIHLTNRYYRPVQVRIGGCDIHILIAVSALMTTLTSAAQTTSPVPRFEDYPVTEIFQGTPVGPILATADQRLFRTRIREGVTKGIGVERDGGLERPGPNFSGHYIIVTWGCGSPCIMMAIVDAKNGKVYRSPMTDSLQVSWLDGGPWLPRVQFRLDSRLMILTPTPALAKGPIYIHYFVWQGNRWTLICKVPCGPKGSEADCG